MRIKCPEPFSFEVVGPDGPYSLHFEAISEWDGRLLVEGLDIPMTWSVETIDRTDEGELVLAGGTDGSKKLWGDYYWFEARVEPGPPVITFWGDQVVVRVDAASARSVGCDPSAAPNEKRRGLNPGASAFQALPQPRDWIGT